MAERVAEKCAKKLLGEKDIEAVLQRLDRLTVEGSRMTVPQTLDVICGLVDNMQVVMDGTHRLFILLRTLYVTHLADGKVSIDGIRWSLGASGPIMMSIGIVFILITSVSPHARDNNGST